MKMSTNESYILGSRWHYGLLALVFIFFFSHIALSQTCTQFVAPVDPLLQDTIISKRGPPDEDCQLDPRVDQYDAIDPPAPED